VREIAASLLLIVACAGTPSGPTRSPGVPPPADASVAASTDAPSERECEELIAHAVAIGIAAQRQALPPEQVPTEAEQAALRAELRDGFLASCQGGTREGYRCARAATTLRELDACYSTRSSSTSNSSVAPGGITPPAPRSP